LQIGRFCSDCRERSGDWNDASCHHRPLSAVTATAELGKCEVHSLDAYTLTDSASVQVPVIIADADPGFNGLARSPEASDYLFN
jgi:hypothetical protein